MLETLDALRPHLVLPEQAEADLRSFLEAHGDAGEAVRRLHEDAPALTQLLTLAGTSRYAFELVLRDPAIYWSVIGERLYRQVWGRRLLAEVLRRDLDSLNAGAGLEQRFEAIARFKHRHSLRIILGDLSTALSLEAVVRELSDLVDVVVQACLELALERTASRRPAGLLPDHPGFTVLAMGKLGARELNYSSDIDLIFLYLSPAAAGTVPGGGSPGMGPSDDTAESDCHEYMQRLGAELIRLLELTTAAGRMYRVDMRLRPEGERGELALSLAETIDYYYSVGRPWERQAFIKARPLAGDLALGERLIAELRPWVYPADPQWEDLEDVRTMRRRIEERAEAGNVKTGAGGIRDIEFLVQYFQLVHGGRMPDLRQGATLPTLRRLADDSLLPLDDARLLERDYFWLRMVEHRLQIWQDRQEHVLPEGEAERTLLARRCGFFGIDPLLRFDARYAEVRARVRRLVERHFLGISAASEALLALLVQGEADARLAGKLLGSYGFKDLDRACNRVRSLAVEPFFVLSRSRTERILVQLLPGLLTAIAATPGPDQTLENFARIVSAVGGRATFYELLLQQPQVMRLFVEFAGWASYLVSLLQDFPGLTDDVIDGLNQAPRRAHEYPAQARALVQGIREVGPPLRYLKARESATIAIRDLEGADPEQVSLHLSQLAQSILETALARCVPERARRHGVPVEGGRASRFAVLGLGKLGARELTYASDMDVIFVCDPGGSCRRGASEAMQGDVFWTKVAEDLVRLMAEHQLYELDPRLRPYGEKSELVATTEALGIYWSAPREIWERMAMLRVSHLAGDPRLGAEAVTTILTQALGQQLDPSCRGQVRDMRRRLEESVAGRDHLKRGRGGYVDHEFIAQFLALGLEAFELPQPCSTAALLERLGRIGRMPVEAADELTAGLRVLRMIEARMRLSAGKAVTSNPTHHAARTEQARRCRIPGMDAMDLELHLLRNSARSWFDRLIPG